MYKIKSLGRYATRKEYALQTLWLGAKSVGWTNWIRILFVVVWFLIYILFTQPVAINYVAAEEVATSTPVVEEVPAVIELSYTKERVKELIAETFADAPIMQEVARCESGFLQHAYNPTNNSHDGGVFQISQKYHGKRMEKLGLDPYDVKDNIAYARILYDEQGLAPWVWSKPCWSK